MTTLYRETTSVTPRQLEVLSYLRRRQRWSVGEIAATLKVSSAAATKAVARLERKGLVTRTVDQWDRRCVNVSLTDAGIDVVQRLVSTI